MALLTAVSLLKRTSVTVANVDHGLRIGSTEDGEFVGGQARSAAFEFQQLNIAKGVLNCSKAGSLEEAARKERYRLLTEFAEEQGIGYVVTAHHFDDQAETVLHNIARGTGLRGLRGMQAARDLSPNVKLIRPLLNVTRQQIDEFIRDNGVPFREDETNQSDAHTRNRLRQTILPQLKESVNAAADRHLVQLASQSLELLEGLDEIAAKILGEVVLERSENTCRIDRTKFITWPESVIRHATSLLWIQLDWPRRKMTKEHYGQLSHMVFHGKPAKIDLPGRVTAEVTEDMLRLRRRIE